MKDPDSRGAWSEVEDDPAVPVDPLAASPERYLRGGLLGRGGMGQVFAAEDRLLGREVALKELAPELRDTAAAHRRMLREAWITARLDHPGIVAVHDAGTVADGRPFYTMRLVRGHTLARAIAEAATPEARIALCRHLLTACEAVAAAHEAGIVHRDLKPANILIGRHGETQVIDWGLAAPTPEAEARWASLPPAVSGTGGTPGFTCPEQAAGAAPDPRHDVWSLGATLRAILGDAPTPELEAIASVALASDAAVRYRDASALAEDLLSWFEGRRVSAYTYTPMETLRRFVRAWRAPLVVGGLASVALAASAGFGWWTTRTERDRAVAAEEIAETARLNAEENLARTWVEQAVAAVGAGERARAELRAAQALALHEDPLARGVIAAYGRAARPTVTTRAIAPVCEWSVVLPGRVDPAKTRILCGTEELTLWQDDAPLWTLPFVVNGGGPGPEGDTVLVWAKDDTTWLLDVATGRVLRKAQIASDWSAMRPPRILGVPESYTGTSPCPGALDVVAWSDQGFAGVCNDGRLAVNERIFRTPLADEQEAASLAWLPDGSLVAGTLRGGLRHLDSRTGTVLHRIESDLGSITAIAVDPAGGRVVVGGSRGPLMAWDVVTGEWLAEVPAEAPRSFAFATDGLRVHTRSSLRTFALPVGAAPTVLDVGAGIADVQISPDGKELALALGDGRVVRFDVSTAERHEYRLGEDVVKAVAWPPEGPVATSMTGLRLAALGSGGPVVLPEARPLRRLMALPGGDLLGAGFGTGLFRWSRRGEGYASPELSFDEELFADLEPVGAGWVGLTAKGEIFVATNGAPERRQGPSEGRQIAAYVGAEPLVAVSLRDVVELDSGGAVRRLEAPGADLGDIAFDPGGTLLAAAAMDGRTRVWDVASGVLVAELAGHRERVAALAWSPDGRWLATGSWDHTARLWDLSDLRTPGRVLLERTRAAWGLDEAGP